MHQLTQFFWRSIPESFVKQFPIQQCKNLFVPHGWDSSSIITTVFSKFLAMPINLLLSIIVAVYCSSLYCPFLASLWTAALALSAVHMYLFLNKTNLTSSILLLYYYLLAWYSRIKKTIQMTKATNRQRPTIKVRTHNRSATLKWKKKRNTMKTLFLKFFEYSWIFFIELFIKVD